MPEPRYDITPQDYLAAFSSGAGRRVLRHLLYEGHFFEETLDEVEIAERNFVTRILRNLGAITPQNTMRITEALLNAAAVSETTDQEE